MLSENGQKVDLTPPPLSPRESGAVMWTSSARLPSRGAPAATASIMSHDTGLKTAEKGNLLATDGPSRMSAEGRMSWCEQVVTIWI